MSLILSEFMWNLDDLILSVDWDMFIYLFLVAFCQKSCNYLRNVSHSEVMFKTEQMYSELESIPDLHSTVWFLFHIKFPQEHISEIIDNPKCIPIGTIQNYYTKKGKNKRNNKCNKEHPS